MKQVRTAVRLSLAAAIAVALDVAKRGWIKFARGECHVLEHLAGIVYAGRDAFFFGNAVFRTVNEVLRGAFDTHNGEESERHGEDLAAIVCRSAAETAANTFGQIVDIDAAGTALTFADVNDLRGKHDGIYHFENSGREIVAGGFRMIAAAEILRADLASENVYVAFAAVKNHFLFNDGNAVKFLRSAEAGANFNGQFDIHGDIDLIKAAVKGNAINVYVGAKDLRAFGADVACSFDQFVSAFGKINGNVFKAIFIPTAIKDPIGVYIYRVAVSAAIGRISGIRHNDDHSFHEKIGNV